VRISIDIDAEATSEAGAKEWEAQIGSGLLKKLPKIQTGTVRHLRQKDTENSGSFLRVRLRRAGSNEWTSQPLPAWHQASSYAPGGPTTLTNQSPTTPVWI
jgi:hypothetical protein